MGRGRTALDITITRAIERVADVVEVCTVGGNYTALDIEAYARAITSMTLALVELRAQLAREAIAALLREREEASSD